MTVAPNSARRGAFDPASRNATAGPAPRPVRRRATATLLTMLLVGTGGACTDAPTEADASRLPPEHARFSCNTAGPVSLPPEHPFSFEFAAPTRVARGTPVTFTLDVRNTGVATAHLWTILPSQSLNVVVRRDDDRTVWDRLAREFDYIVVMIARSQPIAPGESRRFEVQWDQVALNGRLAPAGRYRVFATLGNSLYTGPAFAGYVDARSEPCSFRSDVRTLEIVGP